MTNNSSSNVKVLLVRHGQTDWNNEKRFLGRTDQPLNSIGRAQAKSFGETLPFSVQTIYSSPLQRAQQTATAIGSNPIIVDDLAELDQGHLEGLTAQDALNRFPNFFPQWAADPENARVPAGETLGECRDRALNALHNIVAAHTNNDTIIIVSHQLVLASILCTLSKHPLTEWRTFRFKNLGAALLWATPSGLEIQALRWKPG